MELIRTAFLVFCVIVGGQATAYAQSIDGGASPITGESPLKLTLPRAADSVKFIAIGDTGTGSRQQHELAKLMNDYHAVFPFEFVILTGDNMYGSEKPEDYKRKFEDVYKPLLDKGVKFYASLGNHDESVQRHYKLFNMGGVEYYKFKKGDAAFFALNSNYMDKEQIEWMHREMGTDNSRWKIAFMHHPPYSSGYKHGSSLSTRKVTEPLFIQHGINVVFTGHDHFYERIRPQQGIYYFVTGAGGRIRKGDLRRSPLTAVGFDSDLSFMLVELGKDLMHFQVISRSGETVDSAGLLRQERSK
jgi:hypothetical protein